MKLKMIEPRAGVRPRAIKKAKEMARLAYNNREFRSRDKYVIEKHASLQHFGDILLDPEFENVST